MRLRIYLLIVLISSAWSSSGGQGGGNLALLYEQPSGFSRGSGDAQTWIANALDGVVHVYAFRPFHGNFVDEFQRTLFRDWISPPYREDKLFDPPRFTSLRVKGADAAMTAAFKNLNGGAPREHLRVAILASGRVALVDISANSSIAFERNRPSFSRLLDSLRVVESNPSATRVPSR